jgi:hypothetical protein
VYNAPRKFVGAQASRAGQFVGAQAGRAVDFAARRAMVPDDIRERREEALRRKTRMAEINHEIRILSGFGPRPVNYKNKLRKLTKERVKMGGSRFRSFMLRRLR